LNHIRILNGKFNNVDMDQTVQWAVEWIKSNKKGYICTVNVAILMMMRSSSFLQEFVDKASLTVADGQPLIWISRLKERVTGVDLVESFCNVAPKENFRIFLLGATPETMEKTVKHLREKYPGVEICGYRNGYIRTQEEEDEAVQLINKSLTNLLIVGMGVPRQETFLAENWDKLNINLAVPVGGSFDVIAKEKKRAPILIQQCGFEWLFRLIQEPKRLFWRYCKTNCQFVLLLLMQIIKKIIPSNNKRGNYAE